MSAELEHYSAVNGEPAPLPWYELIEKVAKVVDVVVRTPFVSAALRGNTAAATAAVMYGNELGIGPMTSLNKLDVIDGRVSPSAELARALAARVGEIWVEEESDQACTVCAQRYGSPVVHRVTWSIADARRAGLLNRGAWRSYPREMLYARATATIVRRAFPDVLGGITSFAEERDDETAEPEPSRSIARSASRRKAPHRHDADEVAEAAAAQTAQIASDASASQVPAETASGAETGTQPPETVNQAQARHVVDDDNAEALNAEVVRDEPDEPLEYREALPEPPPPRRTSRPPLPGGERPPSSNALGAMHAMFNAIGIGKDQRQSRLDLTASIIGRPLTSSTELTAAETADVLDALAAIERNPRLLVVDEIGAYQYGGVTGGGR